VRRGEYSEWVLKNSKLSKLHMVDPWEYQDPKKYNDVSNRDQSVQDGHYEHVKSTMQRLYPGRHELHRGYSVQVSSEFPNNHFDFIYLDARHDYDGLKEDLESWYPKLKVGGLIAGHDYVEDGINKAGEFGVQRAVWEFTRKVQKEVLSISTKDANGGRTRIQRVDGGWTTWYFVK